MPASPMLTAFLWLVGVIAASAAVYPFQPFTGSFLLVLLVLALVTSPLLVYLVRRTGGRPTAMGGA